MKYISFHYSSVIEQQFSVMYYENPEKKKTKKKEREMNDIDLETWNPSMFNGLHMNLMWKYDNL